MIKGPWIKITFLTVLLVSGISCKDTAQDSGATREPEGVGAGIEGVAGTGGGKAETVITCQSDGVKNGSETDIDCGGGTCPPCGAYKNCVANSDCAPEFTPPAGKTYLGITCINSATVTTSAGPTTETTPEKYCTSNELHQDLYRLTGLSCVVNNLQDGLEMDVDCGGDFCPPCAILKRCQQNSDCAPTYTAPDGRIFSGIICTNVAMVNTPTGPQSITGPDKVCGNTEIFQGLYDLQLIQFYASLPPEPTMINPANGANDVPIETDVIVQFNMDLEPSSINSTTFQVIRKALYGFGGSDTVLAGTLSRVPWTNNYRFIPSVPLGHRDDIEVVIKGGPTGVRNALTASGGTHTGMSGDKKFTFSTVGQSIVMMETGVNLPIPSLTVNFVDPVCTWHNADACDKIAFEGDCDPGYSEGQDVVTNSQFKAHFTQQNVTFMYDSCGHLTMHNPPPEGDETWQWISNVKNVGNSSLGGEHNCTVSLYVGNDKLGTKNYSYKCPL